VKSSTYNSYQSYMFGQDRVRAEYRRICGAYYTVTIFQFQAASNFVFPNANTNRAKSVEFASVDVYVFIWLSRSLSFFFLESKNKH